jgi:hypothetical protein
LDFVKLEVIAEEHEKILDDVKEMMNKRKYSYLFKTEIKEHHIISNRRIVTGDAYTLMTYEECKEAKAKRNRY